MRKPYGRRGNYKPTSFYDQKEGKKPALLFILPVLMLLVIVGSLYLAYRESRPQPPSSGQSVSSVISGSGQK